MSPKRLTNIRPRDKRGTGRSSQELNGPIGIAVSGETLFVVNEGFTSLGGTIGEYTTSGGTVDPNLISGLSAPLFLACPGRILVPNNLAGTIGKYTNFRGNGGYRS